MQPTNNKSHPPSLRPIFRRSRGATPRYRQPVLPPTANKSRNVHHSDGRDSHRISKTRESDRKLDASSSLADKFTESLDHYRESVEIESKTQLDEIERKLIEGLEGVTVDIETHFHELAETEEPLQRPFAAEAFTPVPSRTDTDYRSTDEVLLKDRVLEFRALRTEKEEMLCKLWNEWEDIQFDLIRLAVETLGKQSIFVTQLQGGAMKPGQQERLEETLDPAQSLHDEIHQRHAELEQNVAGFEETMDQIANRTKKAATDMQEQYNVQKTKLFKGLMQSFEQLAAL
ncbi:hypothetical protein AYL99_05946 [Fonsecaea erecta]|uniref:Uncharacterized protein n=1 Tax=Fonsecaea erecta TaxID=1367422 RepID=A0A178ZMA4_9EURO|nr:hypothetical protein AYL99_05946 [Fonsecaea erecta]OAP60944.1 hypothetical protein AYL99_05946 [Fonsecaea erecta]